MKRIFELLGIFLVILMAVPAAAQDEEEEQGEFEKYGDTKEQQEECMKALSVYRSFYKQKNYEDAYPNWQQACKVCPADVSNNMYFHGSIFIKNELMNAEVKERKKVLVDSLMANYDKWREVFPATDRKPNNGCDVLARKATDFYKIYKSGHEEAYTMFKEAVQCLQSEATGSAIDGYYRSLFEVYKGASEEKKSEYLSELLTEYLALQDYALAAIEAEKNDSKPNERIIEQYQKVQGNLDEIFVLIAECDQMVPVLENKVNENAEDMETKKKVLRLMNKKDCTDNSLYLQVAVSVFESEPEASAAYAIGQGKVKEENYSEALSYFEKAVELCPDCPEKENYLLRAGQVASFLGKSSTARSYARQVLEINSNSGQAYMLHGDAIASMSGACDDGALGARSVYWLAADYYARAKAKDPSVAAAAGKKLSAMRAQFPSKEDIFTYTKKEGEPFTVPCVGESTTVRAR